MLLTLKHGQKRAHDLAMFTALTSSDPYWVQVAFILAPSPQPTQETQHGTD